MQLLDFVNSHSDWKELLTQEPYKLKIKEENDYVLFKYTQLESDFSNQIVQEARGCIFHKENSKYKCVCHPFNKFFNYSEQYAAKINWNSAHVNEKIDGSLIKFYYAEGEWRVATNGCINAYDAMTPNDKFTFGDLVDIALPNKDSFFKTLNTDYIYMFELVSPFAPLVIQYSETALYYLSERNTITDKERWNPQEYMADFGIKFPKTYPLSSVQDVINFINSENQNIEGCVVCDDSFNRIKIKSESYLTLFHTVLITNVGYKTIIRAIRSEMIDDLTAYNINAKDKYEKFMSAIQTIAIRLEQAYKDTSMNEFESPKERAAYIKLNHPQEAFYIFTKYTHPDTNAMHFLLYKVSQRAVLNLVSNYTDT